MQKSTSVFKFVRAIAYRKVIILILVFCYVTYVSSKNLSSIRELNIYDSNIMVQMFR